MISYIDLFKSRSLVHAGERLFLSDHSYEEKLSSFYINYYYDLEDHERVCFLTGDRIVLDDKFICMSHVLPKSYGQVKFMSFNVILLRPDLHMKWHSSDRGDGFERIERLYEEYKSAYYRL